MLKNIFIYAMIKTLLENLFFIIAEKLYVQISAM